MYHIIQTTTGGMLVLDTHAPSYKDNLANSENNIVAEAHTAELPDWEGMPFWELKDGKITINTEKKKAVILANKLTQLAKYTDELMGPMMSKYSEAEKQTWLKQEAEATAWLADNNAPTPTIDAIAPTEDMETYCQIIINNATELNAGTALIGHSIKARDALKAMTLTELENACPTTMLNMRLS
ncbi:hypothetical protein [Shewanella algae]|uniref:hypothetical protein n=1 Tax=Shewanella algae TaxID=38313 RepID=UPI0031F4A4D2